MKYLVGVYINFISLVIMYRPAANSGTDVIIRLTIYEEIIELLKFLLKDRLYYVQNALLNAVVSLRSSMKYIFQIIISVSISK